MSRHHAQIERRGEAYHLIDSSRTGTRVNEQPIESLVLEDACKIEIGDWEMEFRHQSDQGLLEKKNYETQLTELREPGDATQVFEFDSSARYRKLRPRLMIKDAQDRPTQHLFQGRRLTVGSSGSCDLVLADDYVSKKHAELVLADYGLLVRDLDSTNGTLFEGAKIKEVALKSGQSVQLGQSQISVHFDQDDQFDVQPFEQSVFCGMYGQSRMMRLVFRQIHMAASTAMTVLIQGETGVGKEMVARAIHDLSERCSEPYVVLNCSAISPSLIESELFGHEKGAFTGAESRHLGAFEQAHRGTLFLDEIGELPLELQAKILRTLEYGSLRRVGGREEVQVDVRVVAATHRDLAAMVQLDQFRDDLYYRLYILPIVVPSLRERKDDIPGLVDLFLTRLAGDRHLSLTESAIERLQKHPWPGNIRELKNTLMRTIAFCDQLVIDSSHLEFVPQVKLAGAQKVKVAGEVRRNRVDQVDKERIQKALEETEGDKTQAAALLGMGRSTLFRRLKELEIS